MLGIIVFVIGAAIVVVLLLAARQPDSFRVARATLIHALPEEIYPRIAHFRRWPEWSPYEKLDPEMKREYSGPDSGVGAAYSWDGNKKAGAGRMEITEVDPPNRVALDLSFTRPFKAENQTEFTLQQVGSGTQVTWSLSGKNTFVGKIMCVFVSMDRMIGRDFEEGLENLKRVSESARAPSSSPA